MENLKKYASLQKAVLAKVSKIIENPDLYTREVLRGKSAAKKLIKISFLIFCLILCPDIPSNAKNLNKTIQPIVNIERCPVGSPINLPPNFCRFLGQNKEEIVSEINRYTDFQIGKFADKKFEKKINNDYSMIIFQTKDNSATAIYLFDKNKICIGHILMSLYSMCKGYFGVDDVYRLHANSNYLKGKRIFKSNDNFFESIHNNFVERYGIRSKNKYNNLFLDAFYPQELSNILEPLIIKHLGKSVEYKK